MVIFRSRRALVLGVIGGLFLVMAVAIGGVSPALIPDAIAQRVADVPAYFGVGIEAG
ncbi:MAG: hypothetical protein R2856_39415 [Caldilineaceae bacterium]